MLAATKGQICIILLLAVAASVSAKRLVVFGDSISDNGNGTNRLVKAAFQKLGFKLPLPDYPPVHQYTNGRWSDGPTWPEYLVDLLTGYDLHDMAVGGSEVGVVTGNVGDFYPNNLKSNGLGRTPYQQTGLDGQIAKFFSGVTGPITADDVFVVESGNNNVLAAVTGNITNIVDFARNAALNAPVEEAIADVKTAIGVNLDKIYAEGGRKFVVWGFVAIDQVPLVQILNKYVNVLDQVFTRTSNDSALQYSRKVEAASDKAIKEAISSFVARHPADPPLARFFDFASLQRAFKAQAKDLGFIDTTNGCYSGIVRSQYATSNEQNLGTLVNTFPGAAATLAINHDDELSDKLNLDRYILETLLGPVLAARPNSTVDFLGGFADNLHRLQQNSTHSNKLGHVLGAALSSLPIGRGGANIFTFVPTCITESASHMYHDEVHPTTKQHKLIGSAFYKQLQGVLFT